MTVPTEKMIEAALSAKMPDGLPVREYLEMPTKSEIEALGVNTEGYGISDISEDIIADYEKLLMSTAISAALAVEAGADEGGHVWHEKVFASMKLKCCMNCGFIFNEDQPNKPCPGPIGVEPRALTTSPASSAVEGEAGLIGFAKAMIRLSWEGCDADGGLIQETALKFGLLEQTVFDGKKHKDPQGFTEDGDWWYVFAGPLASPAPQTEDRE